MCVRDLDPESIETIYARDDKWNGELRNVEAFIAEHGDIKLSRESELENWFATRQQGFVFVSVKMKEQVPACCSAS